MWKNYPVSILIPLFLILLKHGAEGTLCYQCDSWINLGCGEDDYLYDKDEDFLVPCNLLSFSQSAGQYQSAPQTCLKEVTYFLHDKNSPVLDPFHRYNRPHVLRHCGISLNPAYNRGDQSDYYDRCTKTEAVVNGIKAERWICSCNGDGCNSAIVAKMNSLPMILGLLASFFGISFM